MPSRRRFRGTMVVHDGTRDQSGPLVSTHQERIERRARARAPKRRISDVRPGKRVGIEQAVPTVYSTLVKILFVLAHVRPGPSDALFDTVAGWTTEGAVLSELDVVTLEDAFHAVDYRLDHLFNSWVRELRIYDAAYDYMDVPFLVDVVTHIGHDAAMKMPDRSERQSITRALTLLHAHLQVPSPSRRTTL